MKQGTVSVIVGCHSIFHSCLVLQAWLKLHHGFPCLWQIICIFVHDIGHAGKDYLDNEDEKREHWVFGARMARTLFGERGFLFVAGHDYYSNYPVSALYKADKYSWHIAPTWWLILNAIAEPRLRMGYLLMEAITRFRYQVTKSIESGKFRPTHDLYTERCQ